MQTLSNYFNYIMENIYLRFVFILVITLVAAFLVKLILTRIIKNFAEYWQRDWAAKTASTADDRLIPLVEKIVKGVIVVLGIIFIFDFWRIDISPLLATAGIAGLAVSFAVKDSLANMLGGLQLVLDKTFKVGDKIKIESGGNGSGSRHWSKKHEIENI